MFTDGSKSDPGVGLGVMFPIFCRGGSLPVVASVFTAELSAIIMALQMVFTFLVILVVLSLLLILILLVIPWSSPHLSGYFFFTRGGIVLSFAGFRDMSACRQ